jgi:translocation and assembly module TamB
MAAPIKPERRTLLVAVAAVLAAAAVFSVVVLGTDRGRQGLLDAVCSFVSGPDFRLDMRGLRPGSLWTLDSLTVGDAAGTWLSADSIAVRPVFRDLLSGRVTLDHLALGELSLERLPAGGESSGTVVWPKLRILSIDAERIRIGRAVAGHEAQLSLRGGVWLDESQAQADLQAVRTDRQGDRLHLEGRVDLAGNNVSAHLDMNEEPGGLLHGLLGVNGTDGISLAVSGRGTLRHCPLTIAARITDVLTLAGNATADLEGTELALQARLLPGPAWSGLTGLPPEDVDVLLNGAWRAPILRLSQFEVRSRAADLGGNATWDSSSGDLQAQFHGEGKDLGTFLPPALQAGTATAQGRLLLGDDGLRADVRTRLERWRIGGTTVAEADGNIALDMPPGRDRWQARGNLRAVGQDLPAGLSVWTANASLGGDAASVVVNTARLQSEAADIDLSGRMDERISLDARLELRGLPLGGARLSGTLATALRGTLDPGGPALSADLSANATGLDGLPRDLAALLGRDVRLEASFDAGPERMLLRDAKLLSRTRVDLHGEIHPATGRFTAVFDAALPTLSLHGLNLAKGATMRGTAEGDPAAFSLDLDAHGSAVSAGGLDLDGVNVKAALRGLPGLPAVNLQGEAKAAGQPADLRLEASPSGRGLRITRLQLELPATSLQASGDLDPATLLFSGATDLSCSDLGVPGRILGTQMRGGAEVRAEMAASAGVQHVRLDGRGADISILGLTVAHATVNGTTSWPVSPGTTDLRIDIASAAFGKLAADSASCRLRDAGQGLTFDLALKHGPSYTDVRADGSFAPSPARLRLDGLQGTLLREGLRLDSPLDIGWNEGGVEWGESSLSMGKARLSGRGAITTGRADIAAELRDMDPAMLRLAFPNLPRARIDARLRVEGAPQDPDVRLNVQANDIQTSRVGLGNLQGLGATGDLTLHGGRLDARAAVTSGSEIDLEGTVQGQVGASLNPLRIAPDGPLSGRIGGHTELGILPGLLRLDDQAVAGRCDLDFRLDGTWAQPALTGTAKVRGGRYENFRSGTAVESADVDALARGSVIELNATATDGAAGKVSGRGTVDLAALTYVFDVDLAAFRLLRLDLVQGVAAGPFRFAGDLRAAALSGDLTLDPAAVNLPRSTAREAPVIDIREVNANATETRRTPAGRGFLIGMDLNVDIPARLTVRGRGLDSEWSGRLHVGGDHVRPAVSGEMTLLRGTFEFLDRVFDLTKGSLLLTGDTPPNPFLDMVGESRILDTLVQVHLNGPARSFRLSLTSTPSLPQDELLAMILFGRSMRDISPLQAVALAQAAAEMTGVASGLDVLGTVKSRLGLQEVDVRKDENDETTVGVGGYLGGKYYIRTQRSVSGQDRTKVEVQLTPKISVETEVGTDSRQGAGVSWKHDY